MGPHMFADLGPNRQQGALTFVVASPTHVRFAEVADHDGPVDRSHDLAQRQFFRCSGQDVATSYPPFRADEAGAF